MSLASPSLYTPPCSVANPQNFDADPDRSFHIDADPDPIFLSDVDPDSDPTFQFYPDPASQNAADPDSQLCHLLFLSSIFPTPSPRCKRVSHG